MPEYLFTTTDPQDRTIHLTEACYTLHILIEHPDLSDVNLIRQTVKKPDYIAQDALDSERLVYYYTYQRSPQRWMIKVVVERDEIVTAYRVNRLKQGETILWRRS